MDTSTARNRDELSRKLTNVLDSRSLTNSHKRLTDILAKGMTVLDIGCRIGTITHGIAEVVGPNGRVIGIDNNPTLIEKAHQSHGGMLGLTFETGNIYNLAYKGQFDIVTPACVVIWLSDPLKALKMMIRATNANS